MAIRAQPSVPVIGPRRGVRRRIALVAHDNNKRDLLDRAQFNREPQPHDPDVRALLRIAVVWNTPIACNRATADYLISSPLLDSDYVPVLPDYGSATTNRTAC